MGMKDNMKDNIVAKLAGHADDLFAEVMKVMQKESVRTLWDKEWLALVSGKQALYNGLSQPPPQGYPAQGYPQQPPQGYPPQQPPQGYPPQGQAYPPQQQPAQAYPGYPPQPGAPGQPQWR